ncbi:MAG: hypothetical protein CMJ69_14160 [Planctomycetaceae bacterium]|nr:hypothetical protein [Planctomycetaceae bacterium]
MTRLLTGLLLIGIVGCGENTSSSGDTTARDGITVEASDMTPAPADAAPADMTPLQVPELNVPGNKSETVADNAGKSAADAADDSTAKEQPIETNMGRWKIQGQSVEVYGKVVRLGNMPYKEVVQYNTTSGLFEMTITPALGRPETREGKWDPERKTMRMRRTSGNVAASAVYTQIDKNTVNIEFTIGSDENTAPQTPPPPSPSKRLTPQQVTEALELMIGRWTFHSVETDATGGILGKRVGPTDDAIFEKEKKAFTDGKKRVAKFSKAAKSTKKSGPKPSLVLKGHKGKITAVSWSPDGKQLISCDSGAHDKKLEPLPGTVKVWDLASQKAVRTISDPKIASYSVSWSPDGKRLAIKGGGAFSMDGEQAPGTLSILDAANGKSLAAVEVASGHLFSGEGIFWSPDSKTVAGISGENVIVWDAATGKPVQTLDHADSEDSPLAMCWSSDGNRIAVGSSDAVVQIWDVSTGKKARKLQGPVAIKLGNRSIPLPSFNLLVQSVAWNPKGSLLASSTSSKLTIWNVAKGGPLKKFDFSAKNLAWSPDGSRLAGATQTSLGSIKNASISVGGVNGNWKKFPSHESGVHSLAWSPDGKQLACGGNDRGRGLFQDVPTVKIWNLPAN